MNKYLLEYEIKRKGHSISEYCDAIGIDRSSYYRKTCGKSEFTQSEIQKTLAFLNLDDPMPIFFADKVS